MNKKSFIKLLEKYCLIYDKPAYKRCYGYLDNKDEGTIEPSICKEWRVGGITGGNCWDSGGHESVSAEDEPNFSGLDEFLEKYCPGITYLQYKKLDALTKTCEYSNNEYYGNYTDYKRKYIIIDELYDVLINLGCLKETDTDEDD